MFIGHFAVGLGAKKFAPNVNLGFLFIACQLLDLIWPVLVLLGIEKVHVDRSATVVTPFNFEFYPYSHSLVMTAAYSLIIGAVVAMTLKSKKTGAVLALVISSHWLLDLLTHRPDLPILLNGTKVGLGMWNSRLLTISTELSLFGLGIFMFAISTSKQSLKQRLWFWGLVLFLLVIYGGNIFGPKPNDELPSAMIAGPALAMWFIVLWGYLVDSTHRSPK